MNTEENAPTFFTNDEVPLSSFRVHSIDDEIPLIHCKKNVIAQQMQSQSLKQKEGKKRDQAKQVDDNSNSKTIQSKQHCQTSKPIKICKNNSVKSGKRKKKAVEISDESASDHDDEQLQEESPQNETLNVSDVEMEEYIDLNEDGSSDESGNDSDSENSTHWRNVFCKMIQHNFKGPDPGPVKANLPTSGSELDYFYAIFPQDIWPDISRSTNKYVGVYENSTKNKKKEPEWKNKNFKPISESEIKAYIGIRMIMAISNPSAQADY